MTLQKSTSPSEKFVAMNFKLQAMFRVGQQIGINVVGEILRALRHWIELIEHAGGNLDRVELSVAYEIRDCGKSDHGEKTKEQPRPDF